MSATASVQQALPAAARPASAGTNKKLPQIAKQQPQTSTLQQQQSSRHQTVTTPPLHTNRTNTFSNNNNKHETSQQLVQIFPVEGVFKDVCKDKQFTVSFTVKNISKKMIAVRVGDPSTKEFFVEKMGFAKKELAPGSLLICTFYFYRFGMGI